MNLFDILKRIYINYVHPTHKGKTAYLRKAGAQVGERVRLICRTSAFGSEPYLVKVGSDCVLAANISLITHDGGANVLSTLGKFDGRKMDKMGRVIVGNNVYIGTGAYVMPGVTIGDNCVIGAGAVVTRDVPSNSVAVGVPARVICSIEDYYERNRDAFECYTGMSEKQKAAYLIDKFWNS